MCFNNSGEYKNDGFWVRGDLVCARGWGRGFELFISYVKREKYSGIDRERGKE